MAHNRGQNFFKGVGQRLNKTEAITDRILEGTVLPAWKRATDGEPRWPVTAAILVALIIQITLPHQVQLKHRWILPTLGALLLASTFAKNPRKLSEVSTSLRVATLLLIGSMSTANVVSAFRLVAHLLNGTWSPQAKILLFTGGQIWATNVIVFALWYWELDRGGPVARMLGTANHVDFLFVQMQNPEFAPANWEAGFVDYLYLSFTNAAAFSPTDVLPITRWAKLTMMLQSIISLATVALVIARAVNIFK